MANQTTADPTKLSLKSIAAKIWTPTNAGTRLIKYSIIGGALGLVYFQLLRPGIQEYKFRRDDEFARQLIELELKSQKKS